MVSHSGQFESFFATDDARPKPNRLAIRVAIAVLHHGKNQLHSPKYYCELPDTVNAEFGDYVVLALQTKLGVVVPDRLDQIFNGDIQQLCKVAWRGFEQPIGLGFLDRVKFSLRRLAMT